MRGTGARVPHRGVLGLLINGDGVDVVGLGQSRDLNALCASLLEQCAKDVLCTLGAVSLDKVLEGLSPFLGLFYVMSFRPSRRVLREWLVRYVSQTNPTSLLCGCEIARRALLRCRTIFVFKRHRSVGSTSLLISTILDLNVGFLASNEVFVMWVSRLSSLSEKYAHQKY